MYVTLKLPDELAFKARHLAIDEKASLSTLASELLNERINLQRSRLQKAPNPAESSSCRKNRSGFRKQNFRS